MLKALHRSKDPTSSKDAAKKVKIEPLEQRILALFKRNKKGLCAEEIFYLLPDVRQGSITPRLKPMVMKGLLRIDGKRKASSGVNQQVYHRV